LMYAASGQVSDERVPQCVEIRVAGRHRRMCRPQRLIAHVASYAIPATFTGVREICPEHFYDAVCRSRQKGRELGCVAGIAGTRM
jgi:hypothetical protein